MVDGRCEGRDERRSRSEMGSSHGNGRVLDSGTPLSVAGTIAVRGEGSRNVSMQLDGISKRLIDLLQIDGRTSYATLAKEVGLSEAAVRHRVQRLIDLQVMQIVAVTDPVAVGFSRQAMVGISASGDLRAIATQIALIKEAEYVVICAGSFDILTELVCEDDDHLLRLINDEIRAIDGVTGTEAFLYLKVSKQTYTWGTR